MSSHPTTARQTTSISYCNPLSNYHILNCGHVITSAIRTLCGPNCARPDFTLKPQLPTSWFKNASSERFICATCVGDFVKAEWNADAQYNYGADSIKYPERYMELVDMVCEELSKAGWRDCIIVDQACNKRDIEIESLLNSIGELQIEETVDRDEIKDLMRGLMGMII